MATNLTVAWGIPVDTATLGAQLEAYIDTKGDMSAFQQCIKTAHAGTSLARVPLELVEMIATRVRQPIFEELWEDWDQSIRCCSGFCDPKDHFTAGQLMRMKSIFLEDLEREEMTSKLETQYEEWLDEEGGCSEEHEAQVKAFLTKLGQIDRATNRKPAFAKAMRVCWYSVRFA